LDIFTSQDWSNLFWFECVTSWQGSWGLLQPTALVIDWDVFLVVVTQSVTNFDLVVSKRQFEIGFGAITVD